MRGFPELTEAGDEVECLARRSSAKRYNPGSRRDAVNMLPDSGTPIWMPWRAGLPGGASRRLRPASSPGRQVRRTRMEER